jgi:hypothetical protein
VGKVGVVVGRACASRDGESGGVGDRDGGTVPGKSVGEDSGVRKKVSSCSGCGRGLFGEEAICRATMAETTLSSRERVWRVSRIACRASRTSWLISAGACKTRSRARDRV